MQRHVLTGVAILCLTWATSPLLAQANFHENVRRWNPRGQPQFDRWLLIEAAVLKEVNDLRTARGLAPLSPHEQLSDIARRHSQDMIERDYFDHTNPERQTSNERVRQELVQGVEAVAENLWMRLGALPHESPEKTAQKLVADWFASTDHRKNLLWPHFTHLGVGFFGSSDGLHLRATQVFSTMSGPVEAAALPQP